ncbi:MAG: hypothetical protein MJ142_02420 [Clostridia bacterium]|nr:hypothetical protein [Clostridia bacterium]
MGKTHYFVRAWKAYTEQFGGMMGFLLAEVCISLIALCPLLFLTDAALKAGALLFIVLFVLLVLPARQNAAAAMQNRMAGGKICTSLLIDPGMYLKKLLNGLKSAAVILLWSIPLIVILLIARNNISGDVDGFTVYRNIKSFGDDHLVRGVIFLALIAVSTLLLIALGCAFRSGARHAHALGRKDLLKGHHGGLLLARLISLISLIPLIISLAVAVSRYVPLLQDLDGTINGIMYGTLELPDTKVSLMIAGAGALLTLPLLPLGSLITAAYVNGLAGGEKE